MAALPAASVREQVTVELPRGKVYPEAGLQEADIEPSTSSVDVGASKVTAAPEELVASAIMLS